MRIPNAERAEWLVQLGRGNDPCANKDARVSLVHFAADSIEASPQGSGPGGVNVVVRVAPGSKPTQSNTQMEDAAQGALSRLLRSQAENKRHREALLQASIEREELDTKISQLESKVETLEARQQRSPKTEEDTEDAGKEKEEAGKGAEEAGESTGGGADFHILECLADKHSRSLCGLSSAASLEVSWNRCKGSLRVGR